MIEKIATIAVIAHDSRRGLDKFASGHPDPTVADYRESLLSNSSSFFRALEE